MRAETSDRFEKLADRRSGVGHCHRRRRDRLRLRRSWTRTGGLERSKSARERDVVRIPLNELTVHLQRLLAVTLLYVQLGHRLGDERAAGIGSGGAGRLWCRGGGGGRGGPRVLPPRRGGGFGPPRRGWEEGGLGVPRGGGGGPRGGGEAGAADSVGCSDAGGGLVRPSRKGRLNEELGASSAGGGAADGLATSRPCTSASRWARASSTVVLSVTRTSSPSWIRLSESSLGFAASAAAGGAAAGGAADVNSFAMSSKLPSEGAVVSGAVTIGSGLDGAEEVSVPVAALIADSIESEPSPAPAV